MPQEELFGTRDLTYSAWHRRESTRRFVGIEKAQSLGMIDLDVALWIEYDDKSKDPIALMETARDKGQQYKSVTVTRNLAKRADMPCYVVLWSPAEIPNPANPEWPDISGFRVKRAWPNPEYKWNKFTPQEWADALLEIRQIGAEIIDQKWLSRRNAQQTALMFFEAGRANI